MRPLEALLWGAELLAVVAAILLPVSVGRWGRRIACLPALIAAVQALAEGWRWQMIPAEVLSLLLLAIALYRPRRYGGVGPRFRRTDAAWLVLGAGALLLTALPPLALPVFRFPTPAGPYAIGTVTYRWTDPSRAEFFTDNPADKRELMVQLWYPAKPTGATPARYIEDPSTLAPLARLLQLPASLFSYLRFVATHAVPGAPIAESPARFPLLIFSPGRGGFRQHNTFEVETLVAEGYVVAGIDHPYAAGTVVFPDGRRVELDPRMMERDFLDRAIPYLAQDVSFTLDRLALLDRDDPDRRLTGRLELDRIGMFGLSLGGAVTAEACHRDGRLGACLVMDVFTPADVVADGLRQPVLWLSRDAATMRGEGWHDADIDELHKTMRATYDRLKGDRYIVLVPGMFHQNFSDFPLGVPSPLGRWLGLIGPIDAVRGQAITNAYALAFFGRYLKGEPATLLDGPAPQYPEVQFDSRRGAAAEPR
jgi:predicted dienelactone hydrolase